MSLRNYTYGTVSIIEHAVETCYCTKLYSKNEHFSPKQ